ncbi:MAG: metal-dependent hydrolase [Acidimicrobiales bacterium]
MATTSLPARRPRFGLGRAAAAGDRRVVDPCWIPDRPELACVANAVSLLMPHLEPYVVRTVASTIPDLGPELAATTRAYVGQETEHHRQHRRWNSVLVGRYRGLGTVDRVTGRAFGLLERRTSRRFGLAVATASETLAYSAARWAAEHRADEFSGADARVARLFWWHLAEEVEHKAVVYDVARAVGLERWRHLVGTVLTVVGLAVAVLAGTLVTMVGEHRWWHPVAWYRLTVWSLGFAFELIPNLVVALLPGHHPNQLADPAWYAEVLTHHHPARTTGSSAVEGGVELD